MYKVANKQYFKLMSLYITYMRLFFACDSKFALVVLEQDTIQVSYYDSKLFKLLLHCKITVYSL